MEYNTDKITRHGGSNLPFRANTGALHLKRPILSLLFVVSLGLLAISQATGAAEEGTPDRLPTALVTTEILESRIAEIEATTSLEENVKNKLVELYRKALSNLQTAASNEEAAKAFQQAFESAPAEIQALREALDEPRVTAPEETLEANASTPLHQIEQLLQKQKADRAALAARRSDVDKRLQAETGRPALIRQRLSEAERQQEDIASQFKLPPPADERPAITEARRWLLETHSQALSREFKMLDLELRSHLVRMDLLRTKQDIAVTGVESLGKRIKTLEELVTRKREEEANQAQAQAETTRQEAEGKHPLVLGLAERNAALSEEIASIVSRLDGLAEQTQLADKLARQLEEDFNIAEETIEIGGLNQELGHMLLQQRQSLPDLRSFRRQAKEREDKAADIGVQRLRHRQEQKTATRSGGLCGRDLD